VDRASILQAASPAQRAAYDVVRATVDAFEVAAPWRLLYYPPEDPRALAAVLHGLVDAVDAVPARVQALAKLAPAVEVVREGDPTSEEIVFLLDGIHQMVGLDLRRLRVLLAAMEARQLTHKENLDLCELAADLKGKYLSAVMGAASSIMGGAASGVEVEPILFPEKEEEFRGTRELVEALTAADATIREFSKMTLFAELLDRWRRSERVDQYALAELPVLRAKLGRLLQERNRRSLYSGDYHELSAREVHLSERINELERLHQRTWKRAARADEDMPDIYRRLVQTTIEITAILDVETLKTLVGDITVQKLRAQLRAGAEPPPAQEYANLIPLLARDDLRIFVQALLASVSRRASLTQRQGRPEPEAEGGARAAATLVAPVPVPARRPAPLAQGLGGDAAAIARAGKELSALVSAANPNWKAFLMTKRLLEKSARIPAAMYQALRPFLGDVLEKLVPVLWRAAPCPGITPEDVEEVRACCDSLLNRELVSSRFSAGLPSQLDRLMALLEVFRVATAPASD
jgi:hypothetical protein